MMNKVEDVNLPPGYIKGVPRVSNIVSFRFPFTGTDGEARYKQWLNKVGVEESLYLTTAQTVGTYVHQCMEDYINGNTVILAEYNKTVSETIEKGFAYIDSIREQYGKHRDFIAEPVLRDEHNRYQGSSDLVLVHKTEKKVIIIDWKTFGISKSFFNLPNVYKKPYAKIKKGQLQFSFYGLTYIQKGYEVEKLILVYLHQNEAYTYEMEQIETKELDGLLEEYTTSFIKMLDKFPIIINNTNMYEIEILEPTKQYGNIKIKCDLSKLDDGITEEETINSLIKKAKYVANKMKD